MDSKENKLIAVISIKPIFISKILSGEKKVEFRKKCFRHKISHVIIYSTSPQKKLVAIIEVKDIYSASPEEIWDQYSHLGGVEKEFYFSYFKSYDKAFAIELGRVYKFLEPKNIEFLDRNLKPPQNFCYIDDNKVSKLISNRKLISRINH